MADNTDNYGLPYPEGQDGVVIHSDIERLAKRIDSAVHTDVENTASEAVGDLHPRLGAVERSTSPLVRGSNKGWSVRDQTGATAIEVTPDGRTHIYDLATGGSGGDGTTGQLRWHVFLAAGQSNMSGRGAPHSIELDPPNPLIREFGAKSQTLRTASVPLDMHDNAAGLSPATVFAREYLRHQPNNVGVLLVPAARGATAFTTDPDTYTWKPGAASATQYGLFELSVTQTLEALDAAGENATLKGVLWHQGEGNGGMTTSEYAAELDNLIQQYRQDLGVSELPFMVGQMSRESIDTYSTTRRLIDIAHAETPARVERTGFAPSEYGWVSYDQTHFGRTGAEGLGQNYVRAYWQALGNIEGSQLLPPYNVTASRTGDNITVSWSAPSCRITGYLVEQRTYGAGTWESVTRSSSMDLTETITNNAPTEIRVIATNNTDASSPVLVSA